MSNIIGMKNSYQLDDGDELTIHFSAMVVPGTYFDPPEDEQGETTFKLNGIPVLRSELPSEVTDEVIAKLEATAVEDPSFRSDGRDSWDFAEDDRYEAAGVNDF